MTSGLMIPGSSPALYAAKNSPQVWFIIAAAIWLRALLWTQINRTFCFGMCSPSSRIALKEAARPAAARSKFHQFLQIALKNRISLHAVLKAFQIAL